MSATYINPVNTSEMGDPFVMRYNGMYYLYNTTAGTDCWTSEDLINWTYAGKCTSDAFTMIPYAPEVTYYNGKFYMCTSPDGLGHYILESDSPTGPFVTVTDNFGLSIDGNIFIDDNGDWYFTSADVGYLNVYKMLSPTTIDYNSYF
ncbi:MAG: family 43 glycosylhydrolase, partial [Clostridia bacterium]|nr:family 43 glycosylhydrolase [Clostridia bacterium]